MLKTDRFQHDFVLDGHQFPGISENREEHWTLKLLVMPGIALLLALAIGLDELSTKVLVLFHALPTAPSAFILARQLGGDARLMAGILTTQTALAAVTLPLWVALLTK